MSSSAEQKQVSLNKSVIQQFWEDGFLVINDVFTQQEVNELRAACESPEVVNPAQAAGQDHQTVHLLEITTKYSALLELARSPKIVHCLTALIGPDIQLQHSKLATQAATKGKGGFNWHQDFAFFPHTNTDLVAVMVMLDDATPENGCMSMVKGSHKLGVLDHMQDGCFTGSCQETYVWQEHPETVMPITPRAGGISLHHCLTLHGSGPNHSGQPRRGIVFQYRADDAYQLADAVWADTGLMICGQRRERVRCDVGVVRLPRSTRYPSHPFGTAWNQEGPLAKQNNES